VEPHIVVIGSGPGGFAAAVECAELGARVTLVDRDSIGGTCLNRGCIPSKTWRTAADLADRFRRSHEFGVIPPGQPSIDLVRLVAKKNAVVDTLRKGMHDRLRGAGVRFVKGEAFLTDPRTVHATGSDGTIENLAADRIVLAMGTIPANIPAFPFDGERILSTDHVLDLAKLPRTALVIGGGVNGCEFASMLAALGAKVTVVEAMPRLLPVDTVDADTSAVLAREMKKHGIAVMTERMVESVTAAGEGVRAVVVPAGKAPGEPAVIDADIVLVTVGRRPCTAGIGLEQAGIAVDRAGWVGADDRMETNVPGVYAIGDILGPSRIMLAHVASAEGIAAAANALGGHEKMEYRAVPFAAYTMPEAAGVGLTEAHAREADPMTHAHTFHFRALGKTLAAGELAGHVKIVANSRGIITGVHIIGPHASELIAEGTLAVSAGATVAELAAVIHAHPSFSEAVMEASILGAHAERRKG
jgi:dihydrolipoamide dehydrogenase